MKIKENTIKKVIEKNEEAFNEIYYAYHKVIFYIVYSIIKDFSITQDLTQEIFVKMYNNLHKLQNLSKFEPWFINLAKYHVYDYLRKNKDIIKIDTNFFENYPDKNYKQHVDHFNFNGILTDMEIHIINLHFYCELSLKEISEETGKSIDVVKKMYSKALKKLRVLYRRGEL